MNIKGKGQRLIPEELLRYLEALKNKYPDAVDLVEANPTLEGGEDSLSSVLINGTKYAVGGSGGATLDDIVDSQGNKRFIEGDIVGKSPQPGVLSFNYGKWSLSGTHLMLVLCVQIASATTISADTRICENINLPAWVKSKLSVMYASNLDYKSFFVFGSSDSYIKIRCVKVADTDIYFKVAESFTPLSANVFVRVQFDFLIDADYE